MGELKVRISETELQAYGGAEAILLEGNNDTTDSERGFSGSGEVEFSLRWVPSLEIGGGFSGQGWVYSNVDLSEQFSTIEEIESYLNRNQALAAMTVFFTNFQAQMANCVTYTSIIH